MKKPTDLGAFGIFLLPLLALLAVLSVPAVFVAAGLQNLRERRLRRRLAAIGRLADWNLVGAKLAAGEGTAIVEELNKQGSRLWWTPDDVALAWGRELPKFEVEYITGSPAHLFVRWLASRYLEGEGNAASLVRGVPREFETEPFGLPPALRHAFPEAKVVCTLLTPQLNVRA